MIRWRRLLPIIICLLSAPALAQTLVSGVVKDSFGTIYSNCSWSINFVGQNTTPGAGPYLVSGSVFNTSFSGNCDSSANLIPGGGTIGLYDNINSISPTPSQWQFNICSATGYVGGNSHGQFCFTTLITITGVSQSITTPLTAAAPTLPSTGGTASGVAGQVQIKGPVGTFNGVAPAYAAAAVGGDCGAQINAQEAALGATAGEIIVDAACKPGTWSNVVISNNYHTLRCTSPGPYTVNSVTFSGSFDSLIGCSLVQVGGAIDQYTINVTGNDARVLNNTIDGSASMLSNNGSDNCVEIKGARNWIENNKIVACQGAGIAIEATASGGDHNTVKGNKVYNINLAHGPNGVGILVGNVSPSNGSFANYNEILDNTVDSCFSDCIFVTAALGSGTLSGGTLAMFNKVIGNTVHGSGDSSIEIGEGSYATIASDNIIDAKLNGGLICRDCINPIFSANQIVMESTMTKDGIDISNQNLPATFDQHAQIVGNKVSGWIPAGRACYESTGQGANFKANDCEFTAGVANIHSITGVSGTVTLITNQPLLLPNSNTITVAGTTNYNGSYTLLSVNDLTGTYTFAKAGTIAQETAGSISFITANGGNLQGEGIICSIAGNCTAQGNRIKNVAVGIDYDADSAGHSLTNLIASGNYLVRTGTGLNIANITCTGCDFSDNMFQSYVTVAINDTGYSGTSTSYASGNRFYPSGFGTTPNESNVALPNTVAINYYEDSSLTQPILRFDSGGFMMHESASLPIAVGAWSVCGSNSTGHVLQCSYNGAAFGSVPLINLPWTWTGTQTFGAISTSGITASAVTNATGLQLFNSATTCTTAASIGAICTTGAITLPVAYADTNYRAQCIGLGPTNVPIVQTVTKSNTTMTITVAALTAAAATFTSYDCLVEHN